jgi:hypothetical protein
MSPFAKLLAKVEELSEEASSEGASLAVRLDGMSASHPDTPSWRRSVVDLLKLLDLDASYGTRKALALELGYTEDLVVTKGAPEMNRWLLGALRARLEEAGAALPLAAGD